MELQRRLHPEEVVSLQALSTYEQGIRRLTVARLVGICAAMDASPHDVLHRATERAFFRRPGDDVEVDLWRLATSSDPRLAGLRHWAAVRAAQDSGLRCGVESLSAPALAALGEVVGMTSEQLTAVLGALRECEEPRLV